MIQIRLSEWVEVTISPPISTYIAKAELTISSFPSYKYFRIMERKRSRGIRCSITVAFLLFPADGSNPAIINIYLPKITYQKLL